MELDFESKCFPCMRWDIRQVKSQEQTQEVRLSDGMPDIGSILGAWGQPVLRGKEWRNGSIGINGGVMAWVLYLPMAGGVPQSLEVWIPFQEKWELTDSQREGSIRCQCLLKALDARMLSERKLMVRASLGLLAEAMEPWDACVYTQQELPSDVQLLQRSYPVMLPRETGEKSFVVDEDLELPQLQRLLYCRVEPRITQQQVVGDKVTFIGVARCHLLYDTGDGALQTQDAEFEFSQLADLDHEYDKDATASVMVELSSLEPELQEGRIRLKCGLVGQYLIWDQKMLELTEDAYSPIRSVVVKEQEVRLPAALDVSRQTLQPEVLMNIPCDKVVDTVLMPEHPTVRRAGNLAQLEAPGSVQVLYYDPAGTLQCSLGRWDAQWELPVEDTVQINGNVLCTDSPKVICGADQLSVMPQLQVQALSVSRQGIPMVTGLDLGEPETPDPARPSLLLRRRGEQSLWELAKESGSTVDAIRKANGLREEPKEDRLLLIPII